MSNSLNPVFGEWYTDKQIGSGTDGKVFSIYREKYDGTREYSVLKIIRIGENRNERKSLEQPDEFLSETGDTLDHSKIISDITSNVRTLMSSDGGKYFVKYEDIELRNASDGKGKLILLRLEPMRSLTELLKEFSFTMEETLRLGISICKSLMKCRTFGYIYPNLKPENVLFDRNGICKLGDFGSFSCLEPSKTAIAFKRTEYYMAPECIKNGKVNCTIDTYSLGLIMYMLTNRGRLPFTPDYPSAVTINDLNEATAKRASGAPLSRPALVSDDLWKIISKACSFKANERYFTPEQMLSDLKNALNNKPFEEAKYDDIYSVSSSAEGEEIVAPDVEEVSPESVTEEVTPTVFLKEEIKIPEITSDSEFYKKKTQAKRKPAQHAKLPVIKKKVRKDVDRIKKIIILAVMTLLFFVMFLTSVFLRLGGKEEKLTTVAAYMNTNLMHSYYGGAVYGT